MSYRYTIYQGILSFSHFPFLYLFLFQKDITMGICKEVYLPKAENTAVPFKLNHV